jgi:hypothetical protein
MASMLEHIFIAMFASGLSIVALERRWWPFNKSPDLKLGVSAEVPLGAEGTTTLTLMHHKGVWGLYVVTTVGDRACHPSEP